MKTLIVYYTNTGNTEKVANQIQKQTDGVIEKIEDNINRRGIIGFLKSGFQAARKSIVSINEPTYNPSDFDQIIIVSSIWNGTINSPMRTYLQKYKKEIGSYKLILVRGGIEIEPVVSEVTSILGKSPIKVLGIKNKEIKQNTINLEEIL
jgi:flavodoxin